MRRPTGLVSSSGGARELRGYFGFPPSERESLSWRVLFLWERAPLFLSQSACTDDQNSVIKLLATLHSVQKPLVAIEKLNDAQNTHGGPRADVGSDLSRNQPPPPGVCWEKESIKNLVALNQ